MTDDFICECHLRGTFDRGSLARHLVLASQAAWMDVFRARQAHFELERGEFAAL